MMYISTPSNRCSEKMRSLLPCCKGSFAFRLRSVPKLIFRNANWKVFATSQEEKKRHVEYATPLITLALFPPNVLLSLISRRTCGRIQTVSDANKVIVACECTHSPSLLTLIFSLSLLFLFSGRSQIHRSCLL